MHRVRSVDVSTAIYCEGCRWTACLPQAGGTRKGKKEEAHASAAMVLLAEGSDDEFQTIQNASVGGISFPDLCSCSLPPLPLPFLLRVAALPAAETTGTFLCHHCHFD